LAARAQRDFRTRRVRSHWPRAPRAAPLEVGRAFASSGPPSAMRAKSCLRSAGVCKARAAQPFCDASAPTSRASPRRTSEPPGTPSRPSPRTGRTPRIERRVKVRRVRADHRPEPHGARAPELLTSRWGPSAAMRPAAQMITAGRPLTSGRCEEKSTVCATASRTGGASQAQRIAPACGRPGSATPIGQQGDREPTRWRGRARAGG
jgi:hypothetical protein